LLEFLVLGGISVSIFRKFVSFEWKTRELLKLTAIHKYFGYIMIFTTQIVIATGIRRRANVG
jgi:hypothetical protein